jgi:hypothetical protein
MIDYINKNAISFTLHDGFALKMNIYLLPQINIKIKE